jgi:hypothetical protein
MAPIVQILHKRTTPGLLSLSPLYLPLVTNQGYYRTTDYQITASIFCPIAARYDNRIPTRFQAPQIVLIFLHRNSQPGGPVRLIKRLQIRAQLS